MNFNDLTDFEINKAVAEKYYKDLPGLVVTRDVETRDRVVVFKDIEGEVVSVDCVDYTNLWADAGPIISKNRISLEAVICLDDSLAWLAKAKGVPSCGDENPRRAAMIVYLKM